LTLSRQGAAGFIRWLGAVRHNGINRGKGRSTDTLIVVVFGRIGGKRGGAERNPSADYGNGGGQVGKGEAVGGRHPLAAASMANTEYCFMKLNMSVTAASG